MRNAALGIILALMTGTAQAGEVIAALGGSDISLDAARDAGVAELSYRFSGDTGVSPQVSVVGYDAGYAYVGAGATMRHAFGDGRWFVDGGAELGAMDGDGGTDPALRVTVGVGRELGVNTSASLGLARVVTEDATFDSATLRLHLKM